MILVLADTKEGSIRRRVLRYDQINLLITQEEFSTQCALPFSDSDHVTTAMLVYIYMDCYLLQLIVDFVLSKQWIFHFASFITSHTQMIVSQW